MLSHMGSPAEVGWGEAWLAMLVSPTRQASTQPIRSPTHFMLVALQITMS